MDEKSIRTWVDSQTALYDKFYIKKHTVTLRAVTWNVAEKLPSGSLSALFSDGDGNLPDIVFVGLQEVDMSTSAMINQETESRIPWRTAVQRDLPSYTLLVERQLAGLYAILLARTNVAPFVFVKDVRSVSTGFMGGALANKGGVIISLRVFESTVCLINVHLAAHQKETARRTQQLRALLESELVTEQRLPSLSSLIGSRIRPTTTATAAAPTRTTSTTTTTTSADANSLADLLKVTTPLDHDVVVVLGDLNYRIDLPPPTCAALVGACGKSNDWAPLHAADQLLAVLDTARTAAAEQMASGVAGADGDAVDPLALLRTVPPTFPPTYKFEPGSDAYGGLGVDRFGNRVADRDDEKAKKQRVPSWTDRFVFADAWSAAATTATAPSPSMITTTTPAPSGSTASEGAAAGAPPPPTFRRLTASEAGIAVDVCVADDDIERQQRIDDPTSPLSPSSTTPPSAARAEAPPATYRLDAAPAAEVALLKQTAIFDVDSLRISDHRPVVGNFALRIHRVDEVARTVVRTCLDKRARHVIDVVGKGTAAPSGAPLPTLSAAMHPALAVSTATVIFNPLTFAAAAPGAAIAKLLAPSTVGGGDSAVTRTVTLRNGSACVSIVRAKVSPSSRGQRTPPLVTVDNLTNTFTLLPPPPGGHSGVGWADHSPSCAYGSALAQLLRAAANTLRVVAPDAAATAELEKEHPTCSLPRGALEQWAARLLQTAAAAAVTAPHNLLALPPATSFDFPLKLSLSGALLSVVAIADCVLRACTPGGFTGATRSAARLLSADVSFAVHGGAMVRTTVEFPVVPTWLGAPLELTALPYATYGVGKAQREGGAGTAGAVGTGGSGGGGGGGPSFGVGAAVASPLGPAGGAGDGYTRSDAVGGQAGGGDPFAGIGVGGTAATAFGSATTTTSGGGAGDGVISEAHMLGTPSLPPIPPPIFDLMTCVAAAADALPRYPARASSDASSPPAPNADAVAGVGPNPEPFARHVGPAAATGVLADADAVGACLAAVTATVPPLVPSPTLCRCPSVPHSAATASWFSPDSVWATAPTVPSLAAASDGVPLAALVTWLTLLPEPPVSASAYPTALRAATSASFELTAAVESVATSLHGVAANVLRAVCALFGHLLAADGYEVVAPDDPARAAATVAAAAMGGPVVKPSGPNDGQLLPLLRRGDGAIVPIVQRTATFVVLTWLCRAIFGQPPGAPQMASATEGRRVGTAAGHGESDGAGGPPRHDSLAPITAWPVERVVRCELVFVLELIRLAALSL